MIQLTNLDARKKILFIIIGVMIIILLLFLILYLLGRDRTSSPVGSEEYLVEEVGVPKADWRRIIGIEEAENMRVIANPYDGYRISVSSEWEVVEEVRSGLDGLVLLYGQDHLHNHASDPVQHVDDGMSAIILVYPNHRGLSIESWVNLPENANNFFKDAEITQVESGFYDTYRTEEPLLDEGFVAGKIVDIPRPDTASIRYIIKDPKINRIYVIACTIYNDVSRFSSACDELTDSFEILE